MNKEEEKIPKYPSFKATLNDMGKLKVFAPAMIILYITMLTMLIIIGLQSMFESAATITNSELVKNYENKVLVKDISDKGEFTLKDGTTLKNIQVDIGPKLGYGFKPYMVDGKSFVEGMPLGQAIHTIIEYVGMSLIFFIFSVFICMYIKNKAQYRAMFALVILLLALDLLVYYLFSCTFDYMKGSLSTVMGITFFILSLVKYFFVYTKAKKAYFFRSIVGTRM